MKSQYFCRLLIFRHICFHVIFTVFLYLCEWKIFIWEIAMQSLNIGTSTSGFLRFHLNLSRGEVANPFVPGTKKGFITRSVNSGATLSLVCFRRGKNLYNWCVERNSLEENTEPRTRRILGLFPCHERAVSFTLFALEYISSIVTVPILPHCIKEAEWKEGSFAWLCFQGNRKTLVVFWLSVCTSTAFVVPKNGIIWKQL